MPLKFSSFVSPDSLPHFGNKLELPVMELGRSAGIAGKVEDPGGFSSGLAVTTASYLRSFGVNLDFWPLLSIN